MTTQFERLGEALTDRYLLEREIGQGGMATVYLALDRKHERPVAIKVLRPELATSLGGDRFLREIRVAARLQHPNILALYESGEADGLLYYVMPYVEGESLRDRLDRERQLPIVDAVRITCEVADALHYAHTHGVVHRDIKPENILLAGAHPLVADFGIARAVAQAGGDKLTETGMAVGTPVYMSPEQAVGGQVDGRSDQYSLACVLYELLVGQPPFTGPNAMAILARHSMEAVPSLQIVRHAIPDEIEDVVMQALEKTPADRFASMDEFAGALRAAEAAMPDRASGPRTAARRTSRSAGQRRLSGGAAAGAPAGRWARLRRPALAVLGGLMLAGGGIAAWKQFTAGAPAPAAAGELDADRIAVLFFREERGGDSLAYLADGLTETLIHELSQVKPLRVISRNGVLPYRDANVPPDSIGRALKVGTLVDGTVRQSGDRLRVTVSLIRAADGSELASTTVERPRTEIFALQDDLAQEVAIFLRRQLGQEVQLRESRSGTSNTAAWELLQRADRLVGEIDPLLAAADTGAASRRLTQADSLLAQAEALDPEWARPSIQRAWLAYRTLDLVGTFDKAYYNTWIGRGLEDAERALQRRPGDPDALEIRGTLRYYRWILNLAEPSEADRVFADAEADLRAAVAGNPNAAFAWTLLSHLLMGQSEPAEAKLAALHAYEADPYLVSAKQTVWRLFFSSMDLGDQQEAARWCAEGARRFPEYNRFVECQLWLFALKDTPPDPPRAWELLERYVALSPPPAQEYQRLYGRMLVAIALARARLADSARAVAARSRADGALDPTRELALLEAIAHTLLGDKNEALRMLNTYYATNPQLRAGLAKDRSWWFEPLRDDPRYRAIAGG